MKVKWRLVNRNLFIRHVLCLSELLRRSPFDWRNWQAFVWMAFPNCRTITFYSGLRYCHFFGPRHEDWYFRKCTEVQEVELKIMIKVCESFLFDLGFV